MKMWINCKITTYEKIFLEFPFNSNPDYMET